MIHEYELVMLGDEGNEYYCPTCERRVVVATDPPHKKIILITGDNSVEHSFVYWIETKVEIEEIG